MTYMSQGLNRKPQTKNSGFRTQFGQRHHSNLNSDQLKEWCITRRVLVTNRYSDYPFWWHSTLCEARDLEPRCLGSFNFWDIWPWHASKYRVRGLWGWASDHTDYVLGFMYYLGYRRRCFKTVDHKSYRLKCAWIKVFGCLMPSLSYWRFGPNYVLCFDAWYLWMI